MWLDNSKCLQTLDLHNISVLSKAKPAVCPT